MKNLTEMTFEDLTKLPSDLETRKKIGEEMAGLLMDENVNTFDMFEELLNAYVLGEYGDDRDEAFRAGLDKACTILLWKNVQEIANEMEKNF